MRPINALKMRDPAAGGPTGFLFYRLPMTLAVGGGQILALGEVELYETSGGANFATSATVTASSFGFGLPPANINDGDPANIWHAADSTVPQWLMFDLLGVSTGLHSYKIFCRGGREDQAPADWTMEGSNDGSSWTTLDAQSGWDQFMWGTPVGSPVSNQTFVI